MILLRVAWALSSSRDRAQRLRRLALGVAGCLSVVVALGVAGALQMLGAENDRMAGRGVVVAQSGETPLLRVSMLYNSWRGRQYSEIWLQPLTQDSPLPPGMAALPAPGCWAVSPGMAELMADHDDLRARFECSSVLSDEGVRNPDELLVYRRAVDDQPLEWQVLDAVGFGHRAGHLTWEVGDPVETEALPIALAALGLVGVPVGLLWAAAASFGTQRRDARLQLLEALGLRRRHRRVLVVLEVLLGASPGMAIGLAAWVLGAGRLDVLPFVGRAVAHDDLALPAAWLVAAVLAAALPGAGAAVLTARRSGADRGPRLVVVRSRLSRWRWAPGAVGVLLLAGTPFLDGRRASTVALAGFVSVIIGLPFLVPMVVRAVGVRLASTGRVLLLLGGRRLEGDPLGASRPLIGVAVAILVTPVVLSWLTIARQSDPPPRLDAGWLAVEVQPGLRADEAARLTEAWSDVEVVTAALQMADPNQAPVLVLASTCGAVERLVNAPACIEGQLSPAAEERLARIFGVPGGVALSRSTDVASAGAGYVVVPSGAAAESRLRALVASLDRPLSLRSAADNVRRESPIVAWILGGLGLAAGLSTVAMGLTLLDRSVADRGLGRLLAALGLSRRRVGRLIRLEFLTVYVAVVGPAAMAGVFAAWRWIDIAGSVAFPTAGVGLALVGGLALAVVGASVARPEDWQRPR